MPLLSEPSELTNNLLAEQIVSRLKAEGISAAVKQSTIRTSDCIFLLQSGINNIINAGQEYLLPAGLGIDALFAYVSYIHREKIAVKETVEEAAFAFVKNIGIPVNMRGFSFLISAICIGVSDPEQMSSLTKCLYPNIAALYGVDTRCVERNIRNAIDAAYSKNPSKVRRCFYYPVEKPYCSEVIALAVETIRHERHPELGRL